MKAVAQKIREVAVLGNPNAGKTTIFNALTGLRQATANYPGVTVEKKSGTLILEGHQAVHVLDLPGTYSLRPTSPDEEIVHDVLLGLREGTPAPDLVLLVLDAGNLERNLYLASQILEIGLPTILVLNMMDMAKQAGITIDVEELQRQTGATCVPTVGNSGVGIEELKRRMAEQLAQPAVSATPESWRVVLPAPVKAQVAALAQLLAPALPGRSEQAVQGEALRLLGDPDDRSPLCQAPGAEAWRAQVPRAREALAAQGCSWRAMEATARYDAIERLCQRVVRRSPVPRITMSDRLDRVLTHRIGGLVCFVGFMTVVFQAIFSWAALPMAGIAAAAERLGMLIAAVLPPGALRSLVVEGMIPGVGNVIVFLPQIFILFFFIALFEDSGYMARAAFVLDRIMRPVGLNGKAFLPLLSSFACAIPGIMATRTIQDKHDRLATILIAPLMSCSARLPVYALWIGAFIPPVTVLGPFDLKGVTLLSMYLLSLVAGLGMAAVFRRTLLRGSRASFVFELPPYRVPNLRTVFLTMWERGMEFVRRAGTIIFCLSIVLWFLASYPKDPARIGRYEALRQEARVSFSGAAQEQRLQALDRWEAGDAIRDSFAGRAGRLIEPLIKPLGFDWKIGIGLIGSFAAREVLVSTLAIVYNIGRHADEGSVELIGALRQETSPAGQPMYTPLTAVTLMVFFVLACQCMSTLAVVRRETNSWRWPLFMLAYMNGLAWIGAWVVYQGGKLLWLG